MEIIELDIWYAIDKHGRVIELLTSGFGNIPKFIYESKCNKVLEDYFEKIIDIYQFDASAGEENTTKYLKILTPNKPLLISDLPPKIAEILSNNILDIDAETDDAVIVEHTYTTSMSFEHLVSTITKGQFRLSFKNRYFSIDFKTKLKLRKLNKIFKKSGNSFKEMKSDIEETDKIRTIKKYYDVTASQGEGEFVLYLVYKLDINIYDNSDLCSLQITKKEHAIFDFNDKSGVTIEF